MQQEQLKQTEQHMETLKKAYSAYMDDHLNTQMTSLTEQNRKHVMLAFEDHIKAMDIINKRYQKEGLNNKIIFMEFKNFVKQSFPELLQASLSLEDFETNSQPILESL